MKPLQGEAGFTLVELMISLALFGLIAVAGLTLVDSTLNIWSRTDGRMERLAELQRALYVLTSDIEQIGGGPVSGSQTMLDITRPAAALGGIAVPVRYAVADGVLVREVGGPARDVRQRLLTGVAGLRWRYYVAGRWIDRWPPTVERAKEWPAAIAAEILLARDVPGPGGLLRRTVLLPARP